MSVTFANQYTASIAGGSTTAAVVATNGIAAGDLLVVIARTVNTVVMTGIDVGGTIVDSGIRASGQYNVGNESAAYVLSASTVNAAATITVTFNGDHGGAVVNIRDYTVVGTMALDAVNDRGTLDMTADGNAAGKMTGTPLTLTGSSDVVIEAVNVVNGNPDPIAVTAVDGAWTNTSFGGTGAGFADQVGVTSMTAPNWSAAGRIYGSVAALAFGFAPTAPVSYALVDFSGGVAGNAPAAADLMAGTFGMAGRTNPLESSNVGAYWTVTAPSTVLTYNASAHHALQTAPRFAVGGTTYTDAGSLGLQLDTTGGGTARFAQIFFPWTAFVTGMVNTTALATCYFRTSLAGTDTVNMDVFAIYSDSAGGGSGQNFANTILLASGGVLSLNLEASSSGGVTISPNTWYQVCLQYVRNGTLKLQVYSENGATQIGSTQTVAGHTTAYPLKVYVGDANGSAVTTGKTVWFDKVKVSCVGSLPTFPMLDLAPPASASALSSRLLMGVGA